MPERFNPEEAAAGSFERKGPIDTLPAISSRLNSEGNPVRTIELNSEPKIGQIVAEFGSGDEYEITKVEVLSRGSGGKATYRLTFKPYPRNS